MKRILFLTFFLPILISAQTKKRTFTIQGVFKNASPDINWIYLNSVVDGEITFDSVKLKDGRFRFRGDIYEPTLSALWVTYLTNSDKTRSLNFKSDVTFIFLEEGKIKLTAIDSIGNAQISGSVAHDSFLLLNKIAKPFHERMNELGSRQTEYWKNKDMASFRQAAFEIHTLNREMNDSVYRNYIQENSSSPIIMYAVKQYAMNPFGIIDLLRADSVLHLLPESVQLWPSAIFLRKQIMVAKKDWKGKNALGFKQNYTSGLPFPFSSNRSLILFPVGVALGGIRAGL